MNRFMDSFSSKRGKVRVRDERFGENLRQKERIWREMSGQREEKIESGRRFLSCVKRGDVLETKLREVSGNQLEGTATFRQITMKVRNG